MNEPAPTDPYARFNGKWRIDSLLGQKLPSYTIATPTDSSRRESVTIEVHSTVGGIANFTEYRDSSYARSFINGLGWVTFNRTNSGTYKMSWLVNDLWLSLTAGTAPSFIQLRMINENRLVRMYGSEAGEVFVRVH